MLKSAKDSSSHQAKRKRSRLASGLKQRTKRIQIVTGDHSPFWWETVNQMRVTVIHDVKDIELLTDAREFAWVLNKTSKEAMRFASGTELQFRTDPYWANRIVVLDAKS